MSLCVVGSLKCKRGLFASVGDDIVPVLRLENTEDQPLNMKLKVGVSKYSL